MIALPQVLEQTWNPSLMIEKLNPVSSLTPPFSPTQRFKNKKIKKLTKVLSFPSCTELRLTSETLGRASCLLLSCLQRGETQTSPHKAIHARPAQASD